MTAHFARYIIVLDRSDDDDRCGTDGHYPTSDDEGMRQVAAELQEAMELTGQPAGFFNVISRTTAADFGGFAHTLDPAELRNKVLAQLRGTS